MVNSIGRFVRVMTLGGFTATDKGLLWMMIEGEMNCCSRRRRRKIKIINY